MFEFWSRLIERRPRLLAALIAGLSALAVLATAGLEFDDVARGIFRTDDEDFARLEELFEDFGSDDLDCLVLLELTDAVEADEDWFSARRAASLRELSLRAEALNEVDSVLALDRVLDFSDGPLPRSLLPSASADAESGRLASQVERCWQSWPPARFAWSHEPAVPTLVLPAPKRRFSSEARRWGLPTEPGWSPGMFGGGGGGVLCSGKYGRPSVPQFGSFGGHE